VYDATCIRCRGSVRGGGSRGISAATRGFNGANKNRRKRRLRRATGGGVVGFRSGPGGCSLQGKEMGEAVRNGRTVPSSGRNASLTCGVERSFHLYSLLLQAGPHKRAGVYQGDVGAFRASVDGRLASSKLLAAWAQRMVRDSQRFSHGLPLFS
jgi:hypothetical protein